MKNKFIEWAETRGALLLRRYLIIGCIPFTAVASLLAISALNGTWTLMAEYRENFSRHISQLPAEFVPVPIAFLLWVYCMERSEKFTLSFSPFFCAVSIAGFFIRESTIRYFDAHAIGMLIGVVAGFFVLLSLREVVRRIVHNPRPTFVALMGGFAAYNYYALMFSMWDRMCDWTTQLVYGMLQLFGFDATSAAINQGRTMMLINSPHFNIIINPGCNGLEGIFLFNFMLSVMLLLDWGLFKHRSILLLYVFGVFYMFFMNSLRIFLFFTLGYWAYNPDAWGWIQEFKGTPVYLFHSYVGWVFYLIAFGIFAAVLYSDAARKKLTVGR